MFLFVLSNICGLLLQQLKNLLFQMLNLCLKLPVLAVELVDSNLHFSLPLLRLQSLSHSKGYAALKQGLVCLNCHLDFVLNPS